jgi:hypothetical protein
MIDLSEGRIVPDLAQNKKDIIEGGDPNRKVGIFLKYSGNTPIEK